MITQLAVYTAYIPGIYCLLGGVFSSLPPITRTRITYWLIGKCIYHLSSNLPWSEASRRNIHNCRPFFLELLNWQYTPWRIHGTNGIFTYMKTIKINYINVGKYNIHGSGQIIATSHDLTPKGSLVTGIPLFQGNPGWWNIIPFGQMDGMGTIQLLFIYIHRSAPILPSHIPSAGSVVSDCRLLSLEC